MLSYAANKWLILRFSHQILLILEQHPPIYCTQVASVFMQPLNGLFCPVTVQCTTIINLEQQSPIYPAHNLRLFLAASIWPLLSFNV